jgi:hypothetical protein
MVRILAFLTLLGLCGPAVADLVAFRDAQRAISFSYDDRLWKRSVGEQPGKLISIERRLLGGELTGLCAPKAQRNRLRSEHRRSRA